MSCIKILQQMFKAIFFLIFSVGFFRNCMYFTSFQFISIFRRILEWFYKVALSPFDRWGNRNTEQVSNFLKVVG